MQNVIEQKSIIIQGTLVNYIQSVNPNAHKTILFLHGWRSSSQVWLSLMNYFSSLNYSVYAIDLPGFGKSELPKKSLNTQDYADTVSEFIRKLNLKNVVLIGHSHGGRVAMKLCSGDNKDLIQKLVLVDASGIKNNKEGLSVKRIAAKAVKPFFKPKFMQGLRRKIYKSMGAEDYIETPELQQTFLNLINEDLTDSLSLITIPTLIVWGEKDKDTPVRMAQTMNMKIKGSKLEILHNASHYSFLDQPKEFKEVLLRFI